MTLPLRLPRRRIELRWWWETSPPGEPVHAKDPLTARLYLARIGAEELIELRSFLRRGSPGQHCAPDDTELLDQLAHAVAAGRVLLTELPAEALPAVYTDEVEEAPVERVARPAPEVVDEPCWPCLQRAAASAGALRDASAAGLPFIAEG